MNNLKSQVIRLVGDALRPNLKRNTNKIVRLEEDFYQEGLPAVVRKQVNGSRGQSGLSPDIAVPP